METQRAASIGGDPKGEDLRGVPGGEGVSQGAGPGAGAPTPADEMLAAFMRKGSAAVEVMSKTPSLSQVRAAPKVRYTHEAMVDLIVENPWIHQNTLAAHFGYSPAWISTVITSDAFKARLALRKEEVVDPELRVSLEERFRALVTQSLRVLQEKISKPASEVSDQLALRVADLGAKALGIGGHSPPTVLVTSEERIARLAHRFEALQGRGQVVDVEARAV